MYCLFKVRPKKIPVVPVPDRPYFFLSTLLFFQRDWPCEPIFSGWLRAAHTACQNGVCCHTNYWTKLPKFVHRKYACLVNIDVGTLLQIAQQKNAKTMKQIFKKKIYFRPTDPNFFTIWNRNHRYFFFTPKEIPVVPVPDRPYFFLPTLLFFQRDWQCEPIFSAACQNGVSCHTNYWNKLPKFIHRKYESLVNIDVGTLLKIAQQKNAKTMKKIFNKKRFPIYRP
jgi:hypothetical protein